MTLTLGLVSTLIILTGVIRIIRTTPDILMPGRMEPARWRRALANLAIVWAGLGVLNLALAIHSGPTTWYNAVGIIVWVGLGVLLGRQLWVARKTRQTQG